MTKAEEVYQEITCYANYSEMNGIEKEYIIECIDKALKEQLSISRVRKSLPSKDLANWTIKNGWCYNFSDGKWWKLQDSHNYIKKTTKEIANMIESNVC